MSIRIAPNGNYYRVEYIGSSGGAYRPLSVSAASLPLAVQPELAEQQVRKDIVGGVISKQPLAMGSMTIMDVQPTATQYTAYQEIVEGAGGVTGTNSTISRTVDTSIRLVTLRVVVDVKSIQGVSYYYTITGAQLQFPPQRAEADTGNTLDVQIKVWGDVGAPVYGATP
jgi:hypothetical protein